MEGVAGAVDLFDIEAAVRRVEPRPELAVRGCERLEVWVREERGAVAEGDAGGWVVRAERWWRVRRAKRLRRIRKV